MDQRRREVNSGDACIDAVGVAQIVSFDRVKAADLECEDVSDLDRDARQWASIACCLSHAAYGSVHVYVSGSYT